MAWGCKSRVGSAKYKNRAKKRPEDFTRKRKMGFTDIIYFILNMVKGSTQNELHRYFAMKGAGTRMSQQAFSLARQKIKWEAFRELFDYEVAMNYEYEEYHEIKRWEGYRLLAIDGSKITMPNEPELGEHYGRMQGSPTAQGSLLYDLLNDVIVDARIEPLSVDERSLAEKHLKHLKGLKSFGKELVLFDRGYASYELIKGLKRRGIHFVMREKFSTAIDALEEGIHEVRLGGTLLNGIGVRVVKFQLPGGAMESLITDVTDRKYGTEEFKVLYFKRWPIETKYDELKKKLELENFSGRLVDNTRQDFYAMMFLSNFAAALYQEAQEEVEEERREKENKYHYQVNVNHEIGILKDRLIKTVIEDDEKKRGMMFDETIELLKSRLIPIRPNRSTPRQSPRKARFHHNHKSNC